MVVMAILEVEHVVFDLSSIGYTVADEHAAIGLPTLGIFKGREDAWLFGCRIAPFANFDIGIGGKGISKLEEAIAMRPFLVTDLSVDGYYDSNH